MFVFDTLADYRVKWYFTNSIIGKISLQWSIDCKAKLYYVVLSVYRDGIQF